MSNELTSPQPEMLSFEACDAYQRKYIYLRVGCTGGDDCEPWVAYCCYEPPTQHVFGNSREDVIKLHRDKYHPDWTPPVEDADEGSAPTENRPTSEQDGSEKEGER